MGIFNRSRRAAVTPVVLALWALSLLASVANACGLADRLEHGGMGNPVPMSQHQPSDDGTPPACKQFCADDIPLLAKLKTVEDASAGTAPLIMAPPAYGRPAFAGWSSILHGPAPPPDLAVNTRFVRLSL